MTAAILKDETTLPSCGSAAFSRFPQSGKTQAVGVGNLWKNPVKHVHLFERSSVLGVSEERVCESGKDLFTGCC